MLIIVAGSRWAGKAGRAAGWRAGTFGCGDANQAAAGGEEERGGEVTSAKSASERTERGRLPATRDVQDLRTALFLLCGCCRGEEERKGGEGRREKGGVRSE